MKNKKIAIMVMMMTLVAVGSMGCGKNAGAAGQPISAEKDKEASWIDEEWDDAEREEKDTEDEEEIETETEIEEDAEKTDDTGHETSHVAAHPTMETEVQSLDTTAESLNAGGISDNWTDFEFLFDGAYYALPASYHELEAGGWSFDLAEYGYADGYVLNPGEKTYDTIELTNPAYDEDLMVWVGFINNSDSVQDILDCDIWSIQLDTCSGFTQVDAYPYMEIAGGVGIGSTREEVEAAFGPCDDIYEADEFGYVTYNYNVDYKDYLKITVFDDMGVTAIAMSSYK